MYSYSRLNKSGKQNVLMYQIEQKWDILNQKQIRNYEVSSVAQSTCFGQSFSTSNIQYSCLEIHISAFVGLEIQTSVFCRVRDTYFCFLSGQRYIFLFSVGLEIHISVFCRVRDTYFCFLSGQRYILLFSVGLEIHISVFCRFRDSYFCFLSVQR